MAASLYPTHSNSQMETTSTERAVTPYLPFDLPVGPSPRAVFAHYVPNFPISIENADGTADYYQREYLSPEGEGGIHSSYGGLLRDRPLPRAHLDQSDWQLVDFATEIAQAKSVGIDGFAIDVIKPRAQSDVVDNLLTAAARSANFKILITADISGPLLDLAVEDFVADISAYLAAPAAYRLADGTPVLSAFAAERRSPEWWATVLAALTARLHTKVAFVPVFVDVSNMTDYESISYGLSAWGGRNPRGMGLSNHAPGSPADLIDQAHDRGKIWMQSVPFQDTRPRGGVFEESVNGTTNRMAWQLAIEEEAEWVQLITWNDYAESTAMAPSVAHGWRMLDLNAYDIAMFKWGGIPRITRDAIYVSYRTQPAAALPAYPQTLLMRPAPDSVEPRDAIEVVSFATAGARIEIAAGDHLTSCSVGGGRGICVAPLQLGPFTVTMTRDGAVVASARADIPVVDHPFVQDLQYRLVGGLR
ncbi:glycoside hydrolase family 71 protein [Mycobacterium sp. 852002-51961_SCH5331710]|uniref:glycoside hydrolase family 71 protein n=1 Tax=Mycobacterium sp. 852002-51961_SCH5331710 TaxID=1834105 RepID=UPI0018D3C1AF|nr:glycoside hydrolase family 71 protein [Mycobacterium sp. 852002-51961_SCH5331710]